MSHELFVKIKDETKAPQYIYKCYENSPASVIVDHN